MSDSASRTFSAVFVQALRRASISALAKATGIDRTKLQRIKTGEITQIGFDELDRLAPHLQLWFLQCESRPIFISAQQYHAQTHYAAIGLRHDQDEAAQLLRDTLTGEDEG